MALTGKHLLFDGYNVIHEVVGQGSNANGTNLRKPAGGGQSTNSCNDTLFIEIDEID